MQRGELLGRLTSVKRWDLIIIGGGATGLGAAVDAAARGYRTLLLEGHDFAKGTSSRSTKLVHGGVRYLAQGRLMLVRQALHERGLLVRNAPHLVHSLPFVIPAYRRFSRLYYGTGLKLYDRLAGNLGLGPTAILNREQALNRAPTLRAQGLRGGVLYYDGQFDDARLAIALLRTFLDLGGTALNYFPVAAILKSAEGHADGVVAEDVETGQRYEIPARAVINATGVYADHLRRMDDPQARPILAPSQGAHLVLDRSFLPGDSAIMIPRTDDGRVLFAIPWLGRVVLGTTDVPVTNLPIEPRPLDEEVEFLLSHAARYLSRAPGEGDVLSRFAGLRPLVRSGEAKSTAALSRDHTLIVSDSGLVTVTGGKWTTYRHMAADTVDRAAAVAGLDVRPCRTAELKLHGWGGGEAGQDPEATSQESEARIQHSAFSVQHSAFSAYGADAAAVRAVLAERPEWDRPLHPRLPYLAGEVIWAARHELARTVEDVLSRRTRALLLDAAASRAAAAAVAKLLGAELGFDAAWQRRQVEQFAELAEGYLVTGG